MKKFQFSLDHVRDYRDRLLDEETGKLQRLQAERITALEQRGFSMQLESIRMQVRELTEQLEAAKARVEQQTRVVVAANQEVSKLDKLRDRQYEDWQAGVRKAEEERIEELVSQSHIRKTAG